MVFMAFMVVHVQCMCGLNYSHFLHILYLSIIFHTELSEMMRRPTERWKRQKERKRQRERYIGHHNLLTNSYLDNRLFGCARTMHHAQPHRQYCTISMGLPFFFTTNHLSMCARALVYLCVCVAIWMELNWLWRKKCGLIWLVLIPLQNKYEPCDTHWNAPSTSFLATILFFLLLLLLLLPVTVSAPLSFTLLPSFYGTKINARVWFNKAIKLKLQISCYCHSSFV